jgi:hypothetical protein
MGSREQAKALIEHELNLVHRIGPGKRPSLSESMMTNFGRRNWVRDFGPRPVPSFLVYAIRSCSTFAAASSWIEGKTCEYRSSVNEMLACPN